MISKSDLCREYFTKFGEDFTKAAIARKLMVDFPDVFTHEENTRRLIEVSQRTKSLAESQQERDLVQYKDPNISSDKKIAEFHWRKILPVMQEFQKQVSEASGSQDKSNWKIETNDEICVVVIGDLQLGSWATDYGLFLEITREILETKNLYVILVGDLLQMAIKMRNVLEVQDNLLPPKFQMMFLDSWLQDIKHKVIASTWDNHSVMREEAQVGYSSYAEIFKRHTIYHNGIGHIDLTVGNVVYRGAISHFFRGKSILNKTHAPSRYMRHEAQDRDFALQGDFHDPGMQKYQESGREKIAIVCGSIQTNSGYAKRFYSITTCPAYPCIVLNPKEKIMTPYWSVKEWLMANPPKAN
jgi:hypothetical protein